MDEEIFKKLIGLLSPQVEGFMQANPEWLAEVLAQTLASEMPNWIIQWILEQAVDLLIANLIAKGKIKVEGEMLCWVNAE
jgi:hypothetical protein